MKLIGLVRCLNEEENILSFLDNVYTFQDHLCIVDGGSTDRTRELVLRWEMRNGPGFIIWEDFTEGSISNEVYFTHEARQLNQGAERIRREFKGEEVYIVLSDVDEHFCLRVQKHLREYLQQGPDALQLYGIHLIGDKDHFAVKTGQDTMIIREPGGARIGRLIDSLRFYGAAHSTHLAETYPDAVTVQGATFHYGYMDREKEKLKIALRAVALRELDDTYRALAERQNQYVTERVPWDMCSPDCRSCWIADYLDFLKGNSLA